MLPTALLIAAALLGAPTPPPQAADISVTLVSPRATLLLLGAQFDLSITNHGPDPLTSATVVIEFGAPAGAHSSTPCTFDTTANSLTCTFGPLPVGATATYSRDVYLMPPSGPPSTFTNTATRTASTPADPNTANDSVTSDCFYVGAVLPPEAGPSLHC